MRYVLDTNVVSALMKGSSAAEARVSGVRLLDVLLPQPVLAEIAVGIEMLPRSRKERELRRRLETVASIFPRSTWTDEVSQVYGRLKAALSKRGAMIEDFDVAIAAHALVENAVLATDNVRHFERVTGLQLENWLGDD